MQYLITGSELLSMHPEFKLVGRVADMKRLTSVLMRSKAASVILVGPGGVGASALIMGLQELKDSPDVPFDIVSKRIFWLKTDELFSSGNHETINAGFNGVLNILKRTPDSVLVIEDARDFIEAARTNGCSHFINSLNACLKAGETQVVLEVRDPDIEMVLAAHSDMRQCYTIVDMNEPVGKDLEDIVKSNAMTLSKHHGIAVQDDAVATAIELTNKYRTRDSSLSRAQPERSANLIDRAFATYRLDAHKQHPEIAMLLASGVAADDPRIVKLNEQFSEVQARIKQLFKLQRDGELAVFSLEEQIAAIQKEEAAATARGESPEHHVDAGAHRIKMFAKIASAGGFDSAAVRDLRTKIREFQSIINENRAEFDVLTGDINDQLALTKEHILSEFSRLSGIPASKLNEDEKVKLRNLESVLNSRVFGQESVIHKIVNAIKVARIGQRNGSKPQASFLIMGPSGTGKCLAQAHPVTVRLSSPEGEKYVTTSPIGSIFELIEDRYGVVVGYDDIVSTTWPIDIQDEYGNWVPVVGLLKKKDIGFKVTFSDGTAIQGADRHKLIVSTGRPPVFLGDLSVADSVVKADGSVVTVVNVDPIPDTTFYDLSLDTDTHLYQCSHGFVHHNTEVCKALAYALKDDESALTRYDMSEYMEKHSVAKLIGAPAGYEGSERGGILTNDMRSNPHRIILFDEIEKADPAIFDLFLQILSDGRLTDSHGRVVNFSESMIIMTTNIGQSFFLDPSLSKEESAAQANIELDQIYRPEFLNRFGGRENIVCFDRLGIDSIEKIVKRELSGMVAAYTSSGLSVNISDKTIRDFCEDNYDPKHGARGLQGYIVANIEPLIVNMILEHNVEGKTIDLTYDVGAGKFDYSVK